jgi:NMD protein affecting ribosome stability and mRNA decay
MIECKKCGIELGEETPQQNDMCIDCFADDWGELVELSPMVSPSILNKKIDPGVLH